MEHIFMETMELITDISPKLAEWEQTIQAMQARADGWLTFSSICGWLGCALSLVALGLLLENIRGGGKHGKD